MRSYSPSSLQALPAPSLCLPEWAPLCIGVRVGLQGEAAGPPGGGQLCPSSRLGTLPLTRREDPSEVHAPSLLAMRTAGLVPCSFRNQGSRPDGSTNQTSSHSQLFLNSFKICSKNHNNTSGTFCFKLGQLGSSFSSTSLMFYKSKPGFSSLTSFFLARSCGVLRKNNRKFQMQLNLLF